MKSSYPRTVLKQIPGDVKRYCHSKGYVEGHGINNFIPHDCVAAYQMAKYLITSGSFDHFIAIAPEGHIYSYFFELLGTEVLSLFADYPPTLAKEWIDMRFLIQIGR